MKPFAINAALPLLERRDHLLTALAAVRRVETIDVLVPAHLGEHLPPLPVPTYAAQAIIQSMIDAVEADLRALGVDLDD